MGISHKERLIKDMLSVCSLSSDELSDASRMEFIDKAISWHYTDRDECGRTAKIKGCPYWTEAALERFLSGQEKHRDGDYRHEHIIPRIIFKEAIFNGLFKNYTTNELKDIFDRNLIGCVVTQDEDSLLNEYKSSMPGDESEKDFFSIADPWARYKAVGLTKICKVEWKHSGNGWKYVSHTLMTL